MDNLIIIVHLSTVSIFSDTFQIVSGLIFVSNLVYLVYVDDNRLCCVMLIMYLLLFSTLPKLGHGRSHFLLVILSIFFAQLQQSPQLFLLLPEHSPYTTRHWYFCSTQCLLFFKCTPLTGFDTFFADETNSPWK